MNRETTLPATEQVSCRSRELSPIVRVFGDLRFHTDGEVESLAFGPDGRLWSVEEPGLLRQWDPATGRQFSYAFLSDMETLWSFGDDGRVVVSANSDVSLWDVSGGQMLAELPQHSWVTAIALASDSMILATGHDDGAVRIWDAATQSILREFTGHDRPISSIAFSPDGKRLASAGEDRIICLWDIETGQHVGTFCGHTDRIQALAWHPQGHRLASAGWDTTARIWDVATFEPIILLNGHADLVTTLAFNADGSRLACADSAFAIHIWNPDSGQDLHVMKAHEDEIHCLRFSRDGKLLASAGADRVIHLWDPNDGKLLSGRGNPILTQTSLAISPDVSRLFSTYGGAGLRAWDVASAKVVFQPSDSDHIQALAASADGRWLAGGRDTHILLWDAKTGKHHKTLDGQAGQVTALAFSPDSVTLASSSDTDGMVWLWNLSTCEPTLIVPEAADNCIIKSLAFHPGGKLLAVGGIDWMATGGSDGAVRLWDLDARSFPATFDVGATCLAFHPSGRWLAGASLARSICIWNVEQQNQVLELDGHLDTVNCVAYSPDGRLLVSASDDRTIRLFNADTGDVVDVYSFDTQIKAVHFSPDGRSLFTANGNTTSYQLEIRDPSRQP